MKAMAFGGAALLLSAGLVGAQPPAKGGRGARRLDGPAQYLGLTDQQKEAFRQIHDQQRPQMEALHQQMRDNNERFRKALESSNPDAVTVGELAIEGQKLREKGQALRDEADKQIRALLTPDQQVKFDAMKALRKGGGPMGGGPMGWHPMGPPPGASPDAPPPPPQDQ
jgi:Spy/CpxP family protein refolding chaperone